MAKALNLTFGGTTYALAPTMGTKTATSLSTPPYISMAMQLLSPKAYMQKTLPKN